MDNKVFALNNHIVTKLLIMIKGTRCYRVFESTVHTLHLNLFFLHLLARTSQTERHRRVLLSLRCTCRYKSSDGFAFQRKSPPGTRRCCDVEYSTSQLRRVPGGSSLTCGARPRVNTYSDQQFATGFMCDAEASGDPTEQVQGDVGNLRGVAITVTFWKSRNHHVGVPYGLHLQHRDRFVEKAHHISYSSSQAYYTTLWFLIHIVIKWINMINDTNILAAEYVTTFFLFLSKRKGGFISAHNVSHSVLIKMCHPSQLCFSWHIFSFKFESRTAI